MHEIEELDLSGIEEQKLLDVGFDTASEDRAGSFIIIDGQVKAFKPIQQGVEIIPLSMALEHYDWLKEYYWKAVSPDKDEFTKRVHEAPPLGYLIRAFPGAKSKIPVQACFVLKSSKYDQLIHNIIIAEEGSELHITNGCAAANYYTEGNHFSVTEVYVKKDASLTYTMIHDWAKEVVVRPRTGALVGENGNFVSNYVSMRTVSSTQSSPHVFLIGKKASAKLYSILYAPDDTHLDIGGDIYLQGEGSNGEIISRAVSNGGEIYTRGALIGEANNIKAHMECDGLMLKDTGFIHTVPELKSAFQDVEMSHEAAVGKIAKDEVEYLMSRGITEADAVSLIIRGFLDVTIQGLPVNIQKLVDMTVDASMKGM